MPAPVFVGPVVFSSRYSAAAAESLGLDEDGIVPAYFDADESHWTLLTVVPHAHVVDTIDRRLAVALSAILTETGAPVTAELRTPEPVRLAGFAALPVIRQVREFVFGLAARVADVAGGLPINEVADLVFLDPERFDLGAVKAWDGNAMPLFVFHGWDQKAILVDTRLMTSDDLEEPGSRYGQLVKDLATATDGVYRPVFVTYNSRMGLEAIGNRVRREVAANEFDLGGVAQDPAQPQSGGRFPHFDSFGFSMGGLSERAYQSVAGPSRQINAMVSMGSPHHGALQLLRIALNGGLGVGFGPVGFPLFEFLLGRWSPGTADLLDYSDALCDLGAPADLVSGNPTMCRMNQNRGSAPRARISLIAGSRSLSLFDLYDDFQTFANATQSAEVLAEVEAALADEKIEGLAANPLEDLLSVGFLTGGCLPSDGVVCAWSAHARTSPFGDPVRALSDRIVGTSLRDFDHLKGGGPGQEIVEFREEDIIRHLSNWLVAKTVEDQFTPPTETEPGVASFETTIEFNAQTPGLYGAVLVIYGGYRDDAQKQRWKIIAGADEEGNPDTSSGSLSFAATNGGNSVLGQDVRLRSESMLPRVDPNVASTRISRVTIAIVKLGSEGLKVPLAPPDQGFSAPPLTP